jgi:uncharacterized Zn-finger protein
MYTFAACLQAFVCTKPGCGLVFSGRRYLMSHMDWHVGMRKHICNVLGCSKAFFTDQTLQRHIKFHTGEKTFECGVCKMCFSKAGSLKRHMNIHNPEVSCIEESEVLIK